MTNITQLEENTPHWYIGLVMILLYPASFVAVLSNICVLVATVKAQLLHDNTGLVISSMATSDLLMGIFGFGSSIAMWSTDNSLAFCKVQASLLMAFIELSLLHILLMNIERYVYILHPFKYQRFVSRRLTIVCIVCVWCLSFTSFAAPKIPGQYNKSCFYRPLEITTALISSASIFTLPMLLMSILFFRTYNVVSRQTFLINQQATTVQQQSTQVIKRSHMKMVKMIFVITISFNIGWLPLQLGVFVCTVFKMDPIITLNYILPWLYSSLALSPMLNPFTYFVYNPRYKKAILGIFKRRNRIGNVQHIP